MYLLLYNRSIKYLVHIGLKLSKWENYWGYLRIINNIVIVSTINLNLHKKINLANYIPTPNMILNFKNKSSYNDFSLLNVDISILKKEVHRYVKQNLKTCQLNKDTANLNFKNNYI